MRRNQNDNAVEIDTALDLFPEFIDDEANSKLVLVIKHDYYSADTNHGRDLLRSFFENISQDLSHISKIILVDSAVKLLDSNNALYNDFVALLRDSLSLFVCEESIEEYSLDLSDSQHKLVVTSSVGITSEILISNNKLILE